MQNRAFCFAAEFARYVTRAETSRLRTQQQQHHRIFEAATATATVVRTLHIRACCFRSGERENAHLLAGRQIAEDDDARVAVWCVFVCLSPSQHTSSM